ncbi:hypothetical protein T10_12423 [Trichinella papuae]|uniref:Uncharacterized protein n=1 Tax=Trichinella papuae TaxID=268474 RepID=A0A0V1MAC3_9BILA|nr:hypothetical protein T10_12423 [Trichinella papuae]
MQISKAQLSYYANVIIYLCKCDIKLCSFLLTSNYSFHDQFVCMCMVAIAGRKGVHYILAAGLSSSCFYGEQYSSSNCSVIEKY